jgi:hypothetical protein
MVREPDIEHKHFDSLPNLIFNRSSQLTPTMKKMSLARHGFAGRVPRRCKAGMTLLEMTVVIGVLLSFATLLFIGGRAWKRGSDRVLCLVNLGAVQKGVRGFSNLYDYRPGEAVANLESRIIGPGRFVESAPACPGQGSYGTQGDLIPAYGVLYMACSLAAADQHLPASVSGW